MKIKLNAGKKYSICSCGYSKKLPYCDNQHRIYNQKNKTEYKSIKVSSKKDTYIDFELT